MKEERRRKKKKEEEEEEERSGGGGMTTFPVTEGHGELGCVTIFEPKREGT